MKKIIITLLVVVASLAIGVFFFIRGNLAGGGGINQIIPEIAYFDEPIVVGLVASTWGGGKITGSFSDLKLTYRIVGENSYRVGSDAKRIPLPKNYQDAMDRNSGGQYEAYEFLIPGIPSVGTGETEVEYQFNYSLDGYENMSKGYRTTKILPRKEPIK